VIQDLKDYADTNNDNDSISFNMKTTCK